MDIYTSYFYQVRFMRPYDIPLSTAVYDPKWYHDFQNQEYIFLNKRGVINGVRFAAFAPGPGCNGLCQGINNCRNGEPSTCPFLNAYRKQLDRLDFDQTMQILLTIGQNIRQSFNLDRDPNFIFLVHEAPNNRCSERRVIQQWFTDNGHPVSEWQIGGV